MRVALAVVVVLAACKDDPPPRERWPLPAAEHTEDLPAGAFDRAQVKDGALLLPPSERAEATVGDWVYLALAPETPALDLAQQIAALPGKCVAVVALAEGKHLESVPLKRCCGDRACDPASAPIRETEEAPEVAPTLSVRVFPGRIWVSVSRVDENQLIEAGPGDLDLLADVLAEHKFSAFFAEREDLQFAAGATIPLQRLLAVRDVVVGSGFTDVQLLAPAQVAVEPHDAGGDPDPAGYAFPFVRAATAAPGSSDPRVKGNDEALIYRAAALDLVDERAAEIKACFADDEGAFVTMPVDLIIDGSGKVSSVEVGSTHDAAPCVRRILLGIEFPPRSSGKTTALEYLVKFRPGED